MTINDFMDRITQKMAQLAIDRALLKCYPYQPSHSDQWISSLHSHLAGKSPLEHMLAGELEAIKKVPLIAESTT